MKKNRFFKTRISKMLDSVRALALAFALVFAVSEGQAKVLNADEAVTYTVTVTASNSSYGTVSGGDTDIIYGEIITVSATAKTDYVFVSWEDENATVISTEKDYTFSVTESVALTANFKPDDMFLVIVVVNPSGTGIIRGDKGLFWEGAHVAYTAAAHSGYEFENWTVDGEVVSDYPAYEFWVNSDVTLIANFKPETYTVSASVNPAESGTVEGDGTYSYGENVTVKATAGAGWTFVGWTVGSTTVSTDANYTFPADGNVVLIANFEVKTCTVTVAANNPDYGDVTGGGTGIVYGTRITVTATTDTDYEFVNWTDASGNIVSQTSVYTFAVTEDAGLIANFKPKDRYFVTVGINPAGAGTATGGGYYTDGSNVTLTATAATGYNFVNWTKDGEIVGTATTYNFAINEDVVLTANFTLKIYDITVTADPSAAGTVTGAGRYTHGDLVTVTATIAEAGYNFVGWIINGTEVSNNPEYSFTAVENVTATAKFALKTYPVTFSVIGGENDALTASLNGATIPSRTLVEHGSNLVFTANPPTGYRIRKWSLNGVLISNNTSATYHHDHLSTPIMVRVTIEALPVVSIDGLPADLVGSEYSIMATCGVHSVAVTTTVDDPNATVEINGMTGEVVELPLPNYGENVVPINVIAQNGEIEAYTLKVNKPAPFEQLVVMRWNNTLSVINNPANNGGFKFTSYRWFRDGQMFCTEQWFTEDQHGRALNPEHEYQVEATTTDGKVLNTCTSVITLKNSTSMEMIAHPNPVDMGQTLYIEADVDDHLLINAVIEVYDLTGNRIDHMRAQGRLTPVSVRYTTGVYVFVLKGAEGFTKELRVAVR